LSSLRAGATLVVFENGSVAQLVSQKICLLNNLIALLGKVGIVNGTQKSGY